MPHQEQESDSELLQRHLRDGCDSAFSCLVNRHLSMVYGTALRQLGNQTLAEEVAQQVFVLLARRSKMLVKHPSLAGWLYRTTVHCAQHERRADLRRIKREQAAAELERLMKNENAPFEDFSPILDTVLMELSDQDREILLLRFFQGKSLREVGQELRIKEDAAQKRVAKALERLAGHFHRRGFKTASVTILGTILSQAANAAIVPSALAPTTIQAGLAAASSGSVSASLATSILKIMSLSKPQSIAVGLSIAMIPLGYEWHSITHAQARADALQAELTDHRSFIAAHQEEVNNLSDKIRTLESNLTKDGATQAQSNPSRPDVAAEIFRWDDKSPFVRIPLPLLPRLRFGEFEERIRRDGKTNVVQMLPLSTNGTPKTALLAAMGVSEPEAKRLTELTENLFRNVDEIYKRTSKLTQKPWPPNNPDPGNDSVELKMPAFPEEGAMLRERYRAEVAELLGEARAEAFWQQTSPAFTEYLNDFGAQERTLQLVLTPYAADLFDSTPKGSHVVPIATRTAPLPGVLQARVNQWKQRNSPQAK